MFAIPLHGAGQIFCLHLMVFLQHTILSIRAFMFEFNTTLLMKIENGIGRITASTIQIAAKIRLQQNVLQNCPEN